MTELCKTQLSVGLEMLDLSVSDEQKNQLLHYVELLIKWNRTYNLTAVRKPQQIIDRHILDSLTIAEYLHGWRFADIGSGAGLPGIPLAIVLPEREFDLIDGLGKRTRFLFQVKNELGLSNVQVHHSRVESFQSVLGYDGVITRAFSSLAEMLKVSGHLCARGGFFYAMKGAIPEQELVDIDSDFQLHEVTSLTVPGLDEQRHLVVLSLREKN